MSIFFEMTDGTIVEAKKDCNCTTHEGPHWLHMDEIEREKNRNRALKLREELSRVKDMTIAEGVLFHCVVMSLGESELRRLRLKQAEMSKLGVKRIIGADFAECACKSGQSLENQ